jgi:hypothetical protein
MPLNHGHSNMIDRKDFSDLIRWKGQQFALIFYCTFLSFNGVSYANISN